MKIKHWSGYGYVDAKILLRYQLPKKEMSKICQEIYYGKDLEEYLLNTNQLEYIRNYDYCGEGGDEIMIIRVKGDHEKGIVPDYPSTYSMYDFLIKPFDNCKDHNNILAIAINRVFTADDEIVDFYILLKKV